MQSMKLSAWVSRLQFMSLVSVHNRHDPIEIENTTNNLKLSFIESCEIFRQTIIRGDEVAIRYSLRQILTLLEIGTKDETIQSIPLIWHDVGNVPYTQARRGEPLSLADTLICYGEAALWRIRRKQSLLYNVEGGLKDLEKYTSSKEVASSPEQALERSDLGSLLYFLQSPSLQEPVQLTNAMIAASQKDGLWLSKA